MSNLKRLEAFKKQTSRNSKKDKVCYLQREDKYVYAPVISIGKQATVKLFGNVYMTRFSKAYMAYVVNTKYGLYRY